MNKMDEYFKNKLTNYDESAEDDWNLPSDQVWEKALPHFPKKKEKSVALYFLLGFTLASLLTLAYITFSSNPINDSTIATNKRNFSDLNKVADIKNTNGDISQLENITITKPNTVKNLTNKKDTYQPKTQKTDNVTTQRVIHSLEKFQKNIAAKNTVLKQNELTQPISKSEKTQNQSATSDQANIAAENNSAGLKSDSRKEKSTATIAQQEITNGVAIIPNLFPTVKMSTKAEEGTNTISIPQTTMPLIKPLAQREVGIGTARYAIHLLPVLESVLEEDTDSINIDGQFSSYNFYYRRWLSPKWSIATGAYYTSADLDMHLDVKDTLSCSDLGVFVNQQFGSQLTERESCGASQETADIELFLLDGITVAESDSLNFVADGSLKVSGFQFPLMLTRHWKKRRVEYTLGIGASLDLFFVDQSEFTLDVRRDGASLLKSLYVQDPIKETALDFGLYLDGGIRIPLFNNLNLGITTRINFRDLYLSGIEAGLFYRW